MSTLNTPSQRRGKLFLGPPQLASSWWWEGADFWLAWGPNPCCSRVSPSHLAQRFDASKSEVKAVPSCGKAEERRMQTVSSGCPLQNDTPCSALVSPLLSRCNMIQETHEIGWNNTNRHSSDGEASIMLPASMVSKKEQQKANIRKKSPRGKVPW